ncbi:MAG: hypothetical protein IPL50_11940 [Chitinophagaceae bacterium]|nr:hypothetical protein [Chitinophagaceae bacterium]
MPDVKLYREGIVDAGLPENEDILIGYIVGERNHSSAENIFLGKHREESSATGVSSRVYLKRKKTGIIVSLFIYKQGLINIMKKQSTWLKLLCRV